MPRNMQFEGLTFSVPDAASQIGPVEGPHPLIEAELFDGTVLEFPNGTAPDVIQRVVKQETLKRRGEQQVTFQAAPAAASQAYTEVEAPDGTIIEFPAGMSDEEMSAVMRRTYGGPTPASAPTAPRVALSSTQAAAPVEEPGMLDTIMGYGAAAGGLVDQGVRGVSKGFTNIAGLPRAVQQGGLSVLQFGLDKAGAPQGVQDAVGGFANAIDIFPSSEGMQRALDTANNATADALGVTRPDTTPDNMAERVVSRVGEELGAAAIPVGAALQKAKGGVEAARQLPRIQRMFVEPAAVNAGRFVRKEATMAAGAGLGAAVAREGVRASGFDRDSTVGATADVLGALTGAGLTSVAEAVLPRGKEFLSAIFGNADYASDVTRQAVVDTILANADTTGNQVGQTIDTAPLVEAIMQPSRAEQVIPGFRASTADRAGDFGLASLEDARARGGGAGRFKDRSASNTDAVEKALDPIRPQQQPGALREEIELEQGRRMTDANILAVSARDDAERAVQPLLPTTTPAARGNTVRTALEDSRDFARGQTEAAYDEVGMAGAMVDPTRLTRVLDDALGSLTVAEQRYLPQDLLDGVRGLGRATEDWAPDAIRLREATGLRSELLRLQRAALADPRAERGGRDAARVLADLASTVDSFIADSLPAESVEALGRARAARIDEADRFGRQGDPITAALARYEGGQPRMRDERVAASFTDPRGMDRLFAEADTPATRAAIREQMLTGADTTTAASLQRFMADNAEQIRRFPGLDAELQNAAQRRGTQQTAEEAERTVAQEFGPGGRSAPARYATFGNEQAERAMSNVIRSKNPARDMDEILSFVGDDPAAVDGARRAFWDVMEKQGRSRNGATETASGVDPWMPKRWRSWLEQPNVQAAAGRLYRDDPQHWENLTEIADALRNVNTRTKAGSVVNPSGTAQSQRGRNLTTAEVQAKYGDVMRGRLSKAYFVTYFASRIAQKMVSKQSERAFNMLLDKSLMDPETAALLLKENNPANRAALMRSAKTWMGNEAATLANAMSADDEDETTKAVMGSGR